MTWFGWLIIAVEIFGGMYTVANETVKPEVRVWTVFFTSLIVLGILTVGTGHI